MKYLLTEEESDRLIFREVNRIYYDEWLEFHEDPMTSRYWIGDDITPREACEQWFERQLQRYENDLGGMNALIAKTSGSFIGHCGLLVQTVDGISELEVGYSIMPRFWGLGYATEAARKCMNHAFINNYADSLISIISKINIPSEKVARKNGMTISATTTYNRNEVNIFRINRNEWSK